MRRDLAQRLGDSKWSLQPLWGLAPRVDNKNQGMVETNLLSLSYGQIIRKDITEIGGLQPGSYETYNIIEPGDTVLRMTDLQNDQKSIRTGLARERGIITSAYVTVRPIDRYVEPRFFSAILRAYDIKKVFYEMGAGVRQTLKYDELAQLPIPLPPLGIQRSIADYLDRETAEIDAMIDKLDELTSDLHVRKSSFLDSAVDNLYGQKPVPLWSILKPVKQQGFPREEVLSVYREYGVILKSSRDDNLNRTPENLNPYQLVIPGDLVVNKMKAWQGSLGVSKYQGIVSPDYQVARPIVELDPRYLHFALRAPKMISQYRNRSSGVRPAQWRLYWDEMSTLRIPLPPLEEQSRIADHLDSVTSKIDVMLTKVAELRDLLTERRAALITDAVTGRKDVA